MVYNVFWFFWSKYFRADSFIFPTSLKCSWKQAKSVEVYSKYWVLRGKDYKQLLGFVEVTSELGQLELSKKHWDSSQGR